jgi:hypothetical protein
MISLQRMQIETANGRLHIAPMAPDDKDAATLLLARVCGE